MSYPQTPWGELQREKDEAAGIKAANDSIDKVLDKPKSKKKAKKKKK